VERFKFFTSSLCLYKKGQFSTVSAFSSSSLSLQASPATVNQNSLESDAMASQLEASLQIVGDKYSLQIIHLLIKHEAQRFVELENSVQGISPRTLSARLKHLEFQNLITRKAYATIPPKVEYRATEKGAGLFAVITALTEWQQVYF
jgi:DNA-binding HxlR family transcriptional regulator